MRPVMPFIESMYVPDLLDGITILSSARGVRLVRFGQGENKPGSMVSKAENQLRSMSTVSEPPSILHGTYKAQPFDFRFGLHSRRFRMAKLAAMLISPGPFRIQKVRRPRATRTVATRF